MSAAGGVDLDAVTNEAIGALRAQEVLAGIEDGSVLPDRAWLIFVELAACYGWKSPTARAFLIELTKRSARHHAPRERMGG